MNDQQRTPPRRGRWRRILPWLRWGTVVVLTALLVMDWAFPLPLPSNADRSTMVTARDGRPLRAFADDGGVWRLPAQIDRVSPLYRQALLTYEDRWFWHHPGVNPASLLRAAGQMVVQRRVVSGGSTLTMQLARILEPQSRTPWGKLKQILRALQLEAHLSKREILTLYMERAPFGGAIEGVEAASWAYLGKPASRITHAEAALLAVLPQSPSRLRPDREPEAARIARDKVLRRMVSLGVWSQAQVADAEIEPVAARHLVQPVHAALLAQRLKSEFPRQTRIVSTLDANLQSVLEERVRTYFARLPPRTSAALLAIDNRTMQAVAYIGSVEFGDPKRLGHVDMVRAIRSPGSTLKPFLYGMALDDGLVHSESLLVDAPQSFNGYRPGNFGDDYHGPVSVQEALAQSLNVPAVDVLDHVGPPRFVATLKNAGLAMRLPPGEVPSLPIILGGVGVRLEELVGAYAALQRQGIAARVRYTEASPLVERRLMSPGAAWIVRDMLESHPRPGAIADTSGSHPSVAWKTGTSYGFRDAWALGSNAAYTVGVWVGRPDGTPMPGEYGVVTALPLMFEVIDSLPRSNAIAGPQPADVGQVEICWPGGTEAKGQDARACPQRRTAWILNGNVPPTFAERDARSWNSLSERFEVDATSGLRIGASCTRAHHARTMELNRWPALALPWIGAAERARSELPRLSPDCADDHRESRQPLRIEGIARNARLARPPGTSTVPVVDVRALGANGRVSWLLDSKWSGESRDASAYHLKLDMMPGRHTLTALADSGAWESVNFELLEFGSGAR